MPRCSYCNAEMSEGADRCALCGNLAENVTVSGLKPTRVQSIRGGGETETSRIHSDVPRLRPAIRPPVLMICALDDDWSDGECIRVRGDSFVIGRTDGDFTIPHDVEMSSRHLQIERRSEGGYFHWLARDLESTNGTFLRVETSELSHERELLLGSRRYSFRTPSSTSLPSAQTSTQVWRPGSSSENPGRLIGVGNQGEVQQGAEFDIPSAGGWIGSSEEEDVLTVSGDVHLDPRHCRIHRDELGVWQIEDNESTNGTWLRVSEITIRRSLYLRAGEQVFALKVP